MLIEYLTLTNSGIIPTLRTNLALFRDSFWRAVKRLTAFFRVETLRFRISLLIGVCGLLLLSQGCRSIFDRPVEKNEKEQPSSKLLNPIAVSKDVVAVDLRRVRVRYEQRHLLTDFWNDDGTTDQVIPVDLRRRLAEEGIRVGVQGRSLSPTLARLLEVDKIQLEEATGKIAERTTDLKQPQSDGISSEEMLIEPLVNQQMLTLSALPGKSWRVNTYDDPLPQVTLFWNQGGWCGKTYPKAQGMIELSTIVYPDGSGVRFDLLPVLEYGDPKQTSSMFNGAWIPEFSRDRLPYDSLKISVKLLPGQWLVLGPTGEDPPGLGKSFFTRDKGRPEQKIMVFRLLTEEL